MDITFLSLLGAFAMLVFGLAEYITLRRVLHIPMRDRYERGKVSGNQGINPSVFWTMLQAMNFIALPALGFVFGESTLRPFVG